MGVEYEAHTLDGDNWTLNCGFRESVTQSSSACCAARNALWSVGALAAVVGASVPVSIVGREGIAGTGLAGGAPLWGCGGVVEPVVAGGVVALTEEIGRERASAAALERPGR